MAYVSEMAIDAVGDLRPPLDPALVRAELERCGIGGLPVTVVDRLASTNATTAALLAAGSQTPFAVVAESQSAGRGRLDRSWASPPGASLLVSVAVDTPSRPSTWGWLPLLSGVATVLTVRDLGVPAVVKWPNDVIVDHPHGPRKLAGILCEGSGSGTAIVGIGLNVDQRSDELATVTATSLRLEGRRVDSREALLAALVSRVLEFVGEWNAVGGDAAACGLSDRYVSLCSTLGQRVEAQLPADGRLRGTAVAIGAEGDLVIDSGDGVHRFSAGDIIHIRPA